MLLTGADIIAEVLIEQGVDTVFGYPGGAVLNTYDALYKYRDKIKHYITAHEQGASHAADGYARATGKTGVVMATSGPGATNLVTGIATAYMDSVPMVAITGNVGSSLIGKDSFQEVYIAGITMPVTKASIMVRRIEELAPVLRQAFALAQSGRKGPVLVDITKDVTSAKTEFEPLKKIEDEMEQKDFHDVRKVSSVINHAQRPVILLGGGVELSGAGDEVRVLCEKADIPAVHTLMAAGVLGYDEKYNLGLIGMHGCRTSNYAMRDADVIIALGTRFSDRVALNPPKFKGDSVIVQIDIDSSEINKNVDVDYSVVGDVKLILKNLIPHINENTHSAWMSQIEEWKSKDYHPKDSDTSLKPHQIMNIICENAGKDAVYVTDVGQHQMWAAQFLKHVAPHHFITSGGLGTMGYGYGAAIGAKVAVGDKPVIHITGDGSFHMNMNEACTAVSYNLPIISVIFDNKVLGMVRQWQTIFYGKRYSQSEPDRKTDYAAVAAGFGAKGFHCETPAEFEKAFKQALKEKGPVWIDCQIDREERVLPMIPAGGTTDDMICD